MQDQYDKAVAHHREQIDHIDEQILDLLNRRATHALAIGELKKERGSAVYVPEREAAVLRRMYDRNGGPLTTQAVETVFRAIFASMRALEGDGGDTGEAERG